MTAQPSQETVKPEPSQEDRDKAFKHLKRTLRAQGVTIGEIARKCKVGWRTAWIHTKGPQ